MLRFWSKSAFRGYIFLLVSQLFLIIVRFQLRTRRNSLALYVLNLWRCSRTKWGHKRFDFGPVKRSKHLTTAANPCLFSVGRSGPKAFPIGELFKPLGQSVGGMSHTARTQATDGRLGQNVQVPKGSGALETMQVFQSFHWFSYALPHWGPEPTLLL